MVCTISMVVLVRRFGRQFMALIVCQKKNCLHFLFFSYFLILVLFLTFFDGGFGPRLDFFLIFTYFVFIFINLNVLLR